MPLVKAGQAVADRYIYVGDAAPIAANVPVILPAARFLAEAEELAPRPALTGVLWPNNRRIDELAPYLDQLDLIALVFPTFRDGRAYSQARILRERHSFRGELRATGDVLRDQFVFLLRAGFDAFEVKKDADVPAFTQALARYSIFYQPAGHGSPSVLRQRLARFNGARHSVRQELVQ
jgi:uncharacterized protein (DUF934 family)